MDELISSIYLTKCQTQPENGPPPTLPASESIGFLKSLNNINGTSFTSMIRNMIKCFNKCTQQEHDEQELVYKMIFLTMINTNEHIAGLIMKELLVLENKNETQNRTYTLDECILVKIRQEINPFHSECFNKTVKSLINYLLNIEPDQWKFASLINNLVDVYEWDIQNKCFMKYLYYIENIKNKQFFNGKERANFT